ncbi:LLM class flavin-dependent oxidoreductase [Arhodomonas aquaeolei]|uniref:LLM class flavin-dependent oxidoreductase n=1 Tax=Arhodomonas aquaeolei TaxID=2369 RepID=UPI00216A3D4C|nr:LLM class flavin-dependent oxidoreductase [Arhodomonas aquaeolei]MCS4502969.1 LLM class flavin-dependent oxidoreductase [Arhodomonas aquaeolei]
MTVRTAPVFNDNPFELGIFSPNCSGGLAVTKVPERWNNSWENNLRLAQMADEAGLEFLLPIARWIGYGGATNFHGSVLETVTWAAGLLAQTKNINVFSTIHTAFNHPVVVAKQLATMDNMSNGRAGLNVVCGWNKPEYDALGMTMPDDHETRYRFGQEWFDIVRKLWTETGPFDWDGEFYQLRDTYSLPLPKTDKVPIFNAAGSQQGRDFAVRNADYLFTPAIDLDRSREEIATIKEQAAGVGRNVGLFTLSYVVCRPTRKEAEEYHHYYSQENADWEAVDNIINLMFAHAESFPKEVIRLLRDRMAGGHGGYPLVGDPDTVADGIQRLYETGFAGTTLAFVDYVEEFPYFRDEVLPRLEDRGLRLPVAGAA